MPTPTAFIEKLMKHVLQAGIPVWRVYIGLQLIHPQLQAMGYMWKRGEPVQAIARAWGIQFTPSYIGSPVQEAREQGRSVRHKLAGLSEHDHIVLHELKAAGATDYYVLPMHIRREGPLPVVSFAADRIGARRVSLGAGHVSALWDAGRPVIAGRDFASVHRIFAKIRLLLRHFPAIDAAF